MQGDCNLCVQAAGFLRSSLVYVDCSCRNAMNRDCAVRNARDAIEKHFELCIAHYLGRLNEYFEGTFINVLNTEDLLSTTFYSQSKATYFRH